MKPKNGKFFILAKVPAKTSEPLICSSVKSFILSEKSIRSRIFSMRGFIFSLSSSKFISSRLSCIMGDIFINSGIISSLICFDSLLVSVVRTI